jgi:hypothetical protein
MCAWRRSRSDGLTLNGGPEEIQSVRLSDADKIAGVCLPRTYMLTQPFMGRAVADQDCDAFSDWRPCAADTHDDPEDPPDLALADANFKKLTSGLGVHSDDAAAF